MSQISSLVTVFLAILLWSMQGVANRVAAVSLDVNIFLYSVNILFIGAMTLILLGGRGKEVTETLKHPYTWLYSVLHIIMVFTLTMALVYVTSTESTLLRRVNIFISILIGFIFTAKRPKGHDLFGCAIVLLGCGLLLSTIETRNAILGMFFLILAVFCHVIRTYIAAAHPVVHRSKGFFNYARPLGYVMLSTSIIFLVVGLLATVLNSNFALNINNMPSLDSLITKKQLIYTTFVGVFIVPLAMYTYFRASKLVGADNLIIHTSYLPVLTFIIEWVIYKLGYLPVRSITMVEILAALIIMSGATYITSRRYKFKKKQQKLAPKARQELDVLRDSIRTAIICFNDDEDMVAKKLGVGKRTIKQILTTNKPVSKNIRHKIIYNHARNVAGLDHLTGALNKSSFDAKLNSLNTVDKALIIFLDLDRFKPVNDTYGHKAGDSILEGVVERLKDLFPQPNVIARLGGDEFVVIVYGADVKEEAALSAKIKNAVTDPFIVDGIVDEISVGCSIGAAHYPSEGEHGKTLTDIADKRMYKDKQGKGNVR